MEQENKWEGRAGKGAIGGIVGAELTKIAGLSAVIWQSLFAIGAFSAAFWVGTRLTNRPKSQYRTA